MKPRLRSDCCYIPLILSEISKMDAKLLRKYPSDHVETASQLRSGERKSFSDHHLGIDELIILKPLNTNPTKQSNTLKQFVGLLAVANKIFQCA